VTAKIYDHFLQKLEEVKIQEKLATDEKNKQSFRVFEYARATITPIAPNKIRIMIFILMIGAGTCAGIILLLDYFDDSFKTAQEVKEFLGKPMLGSLPTMNIDNGNGSLAKWINKSSKAIRKS
jgi:capsular polysaccharide biosynthesis protein